MSVEAEIKDLGLKPVEGKKVESWLKINAKSTKSGIILTFVAPEVEEWMKSHCPYANSEEKKFFDASVNPGWKGKLGYKLDKAPEELFVLLNGWGGDFRINGNNPNLAFLRTKGLGEGVSYELEGIFPKESLQAWCEQLKRQITAMCRNYVKGIDITIHIITSERD